MIIEIKESKKIIINYKYSKNVLENSFLSIKIDKETNSTNFFNHFFFVFFSRIKI